MTVRFRQNFAVPVAALVATVGASAVALQSWWLVPLLGLPVVVAWWGFRSGVDADAHEVRVRGLIGTRAVPWTQISGFRVDRRRVYLGLTGGDELPLPAVESRDLARLVAASGNSLTATAD